MERSSEMRLRTFLGLAAALAVLWMLGSVVESDAHAATTGNSFEGSCHLTGDISLDTPLGADLGPTTFTGTGTGTCTGSLNGGLSEDHQTVNRISGLGSLSCAAGHTLTNDVLIFDRTTRVRVFTDTVFSASQGLGHFMGAISGDGVVEVNLLPYFDQSVVEACQAGTLTRVRYDLTARTLTPMVG
jgi:hypothetical protein